MKNKTRKSGITPLKAVFIPRRNAAAPLRNRKAAERGRLDSALSKLTRCFLKFGPGADKNIGIITRTAGEIFRGACVLYNRLDGGALRTMSAWQAPPGIPLRNKAKGHICFDVISGGKDGVFIARNLDKSAYAASDPNVKKYHLKTYIGYPVRVEGNTIGALCAVFQTDVQAAPDKIEILSILAKALGVEEQRRRIEGRLRDAKEKYRTLFENANAAIFVADIATRTILDANKHAEELLGRTRKEILGMSTIQLHPPGEAEHYAGHFQEHVKLGRVNSSDAEIIRKDGTHVPVRISAAVTEIGGKKVLQGIFEDVSGRKLMEDALKENEETLRKIFDAAQDAIFIKDLHGVYLKANKYCAGLFGLTPERIKGKSDFDLMPRKFARKLYDRDQALIKTGGAMAADSEIRVASGEIRVFNSVKTLLYDAGGRVTGLLGVSRDVTELKKLQDQLIEAKALEAAGRITRPVAHDFNNILATINGYAVLIMETMKAGNPAKPEIAQILGAVKRASAITKRLQAYGYETEKRPDKLCPKKFS